MSDGGQPAEAEPVVLELSDAGLMAYAGATPLGPPSPGYAVVDGADLVTGRAARARARLTPRRAYHRFWHPLDETPLPRSFPRRWNHADLAHRHLADLRRELALEPRRVLALVAGDAGRDELARLVGVAAAAGWPIQGLVDGAVAAATDLGGAARRAWHLDLGLHRAVLTELDLDGGVARGRVLVSPDVGLAALERDWARFFARRFIAATRFDPLHSAASEQRLYLAMEGWLARLRRGDTLIAGLGAAGREHEIEVSRPEAEAAVADAYRQIVALLPADLDPGSTRLLMSARAAALPGLAAALTPLAGAPVELGADAAARGALAAADTILATEGDPLFVVRLPARDRGAA